MNKFILFFIFIILFFTDLYAATAVNLRHSQQLTAFNDPHTQLKPIAKSIDFNQTTHVRLQQYYDGYPVWGAQAIMHYPAQKLAAKTSMNGTIYQNLSHDLAGNAAQQFSNIQARKAMLAIRNDNNAKQTPIIYVDHNHQAHWAFLISYATTNKKPTYIIDANTFQIYQQWDDLHTLDNVQGSGSGGNHKTSKLTYDTIDMERNANTHICYLENSIAVVRDSRKKNSIVNFICEIKDPKTHHYWNNNIDSINGGYSPNNDTLYAATIVNNFYQQHYHLPILINTQNNSALQLDFHTHVNMENAYFDPDLLIMVLGDGGDYMYPLTSLEIIAHELSHGFTEQHANLYYYGQCGALNESFSDMAAKAVEFAQNGKSTWEIGADIMKNDIALRYMDTPSKDKASIDNASDYYDGLDVHYGSGVYNRAFYLLSTSDNWDPIKAFNVMVQANMHYWTSATDFTEAACGILDAAKDYNYKPDAIKIALDKVGIKYSGC